MSKDINPAEVEHTILKVVKTHNGIKATDLLITLCHGLIVNGFNVEGDEIINHLYKMIEQGKIVEVEYTIPDMPWRAKSFLLPVGSTVKINDMSVKDDIKPTTTHIVNPPKAVNT